MDKITQMQEVFNVLINHENNCCFHYDGKTGQAAYFGDFLKQTLFFDDSKSPIEAFIFSENIAPIDKKYFETFQHTISDFSHLKKDERHFERIIHISKDDESIACNCVLQILADENDCVLGYAGNITSLEKIKAGLQENPPGLKAKAPFPENQVLKMMDDAANKFAVIQFDISRFKIINEKYGDVFGDEVLENIRVNLSEVWGKKAVTCRLGADIFAIFTEYLDENELEERIGFIQDKLQYYKNVSYQFVFGIYRVTDRSLSIREMCDRASLARRRMRKNILDTVRYYDDDDTKMLHRRHEIESQMQQALEDGQFEVYLQPKCRISDGSVIGAEGLVRWNHPAQGFMLPSLFIPIFEHNGFVEKLDYWVHEQICKYIRKWLDLGLEVLPVSVNVSRAYINKPGLVDNIKKIVDKYRIPIDLLQLEITETFENRDTDVVIKDFKEKGFTLFMDDFGSGYSSLNTLRKTVFDGIKLDREFLGDSMDKERDKKVITHTISMINDIGLGLLAEGVETANQATFLDENGCKYAQGFLYSRPIDIKSFEKMVYGIE